MIDDIIHPWKPSESVPVTVERLAEQVIDHYDMNVESMQLIASKPHRGRAIWKIETDKGPRSLKILHRPPERSLFSIGAQEYLVNQGARVPKLITAKTGQNYVEAGGKLWIVSEWIEPLTEVSKDLKGAEALCYGLGEFHRHSRGYVAPFGAKQVNRLHRYPKSYTNIIKKMGWFRSLAKTYSDMPASKKFLSMVDVYEQQALQTLEKLESSPYASLVARGEHYWGLVHQNYSWSNGQQGPGGIWVIDLDGVAYDFPIRDLRKLITNTMKGMSVWDVNWIHTMIKAYHQANPIDPDLFEIFFIDLSFPHEFYEHAKKIVRSPTTFLNRDRESLLQQLEKSDSAKQFAIEELGKYFLNLNRTRKFPIIEIIPKKENDLNKVPVQKEIVPDRNKDRKTERAERKRIRKMNKQERLRKKQERQMNKQKRRMSRKTKRLRKKQERQMNKQNRRMKRKGSRSK